MENVMKNNRIYDFDKISEISDILGMDLKFQNGSYIDRNSDENPINCNSYFDWEIVRILDQLTIDKVRNVLC